VRCKPSDDRETIEGALLARGTTPAKDDRVVTAMVKLYARQQVDFSLTPKTLGLTVAQDGVATGRAYVRGRSISSGVDIIESISSDGYSVTWKLEKEPRGTTGILHITMTPSERKPNIQTGTLTLRIKGLSEARTIQYTKVNEEDRASLENP